jgi:hypothetical protein
VVCLSSIPPLHVVSEENNLRYSEPVCELGLCPGISRIRRRIANSFQPMFGPSRVEWTKTWKIVQFHEELRVGVILI